MRPDFSVSVLGDMPYYSSDSEYLAKVPQYKRVLNAINESSTDFTVHVGDITKQGFCNDSIYQMRLNEFQQIKQPFFLLYGDNDWADCPDAMQKLATLRKSFSHGNYSLGQKKILLTRQPSFPENIRWSQKGVLCFGLHVIGSENNIANKSEFDERNKANIKWIRECFSEAEKIGAKAIMIFMQANPQSLATRFFGSYAEGFKEMMTALKSEVIRYKGQVLLVHGDTHYFRVDKPFAVSGKVVQNFTRVETFGDPNHHWLKIDVLLDQPNIFHIQPMIISANK